jgi:SPASM domain peptide maturase of grasp-with-spasm system
MVSENYLLCANVIPVKGVNRSVICDVTRGSYHMIPNALYAILKDKTVKSFEQVLDKYSDGTMETVETIEGYFDFLIGRDFIFYSDFPDYFSNLELDWDFPAEVSNAVLDIKEFDLKNTLSLLHQLEMLGCNSVQLRFMQYCSLDVLKFLFSELSHSIIDIIEIIMPYFNDEETKQWKFFVEYELRIHFIQFYNAPIYETLLEPKDGHGSVFTIKDNFINQKNCGVISPFYFVSNIYAFTEAQQHNTCLNRKISIDTEGYIRNCPSMPEHYGNIKDTTLQEAMQHPDFKKYWFINKDQIAVCKDCEFRYICTDCRAYLEDPKDILSKPLKCGYNPYSGESTDWFLDSQKRKTIDFYELGELKFQEINLI